MSLSTHVLDTVAGRPASGVPVLLQRQVRTSDSVPAGWLEAASATTDGDGRVGELPADRAGVWRLVFDTSGRSEFYPEVVVTFVVTDPDEHLHVPLLLAPYGYSTYRGS
jgi:5-hydroxyisourate hydrolase